MSSMLRIGVSWASGGGQSHSNRDSRVGGVGVVCVNARKLVGKDGVLSLPWYP